jgi:hypothetical protein
MYIEKYEGHLYRIKQLQTFLLYLPLFTGYEPGSPNYQPLLNQPPSKSATEQIGHQANQQLANQQSANQQSATNQPPSKSATKQNQLLSKSATKQINDQQINNQQINYQQINYQQINKFNYKKQ